MRRKIAESFELNMVVHCPIWLCNHVESSKEKMVEHLVNDHSDEDADAEKKEDEIWNKL